MKWIIAILIFFPMMVFNAWMDTLAHHFSQSIFKNKNPEKWNPALSHKEKYEADGKTRKKILGIIIPAALSDPWHRFKAAFLLFTFLPIAILAEPHFYSWWLNLLIQIITWAVVWEIIYNVSSGKHILSAWRKKN